MVNKKNTDSMVILEYTSDHAYSNDTVGVKSWSHISVTVPRM